MTIRELVIKLGFKVDATALEQFDKKLGGAALNLGIIGGAAAAAGGALLAAAKMTASAAGEAYEASRRMGLTTEAYQELDYAARLSGTSIQGVGVGIRRLSMLFDQAKKPGSEAARTLKDLGLTADDMAGPVDKAFEKIADRVKEMPDGPKKIALAQQAFGRSGMMMINLLNEGGDGIRKLRGEAVDLGLVIADDVAGQAESFGDSLDKLGMLSKGLMYTVGNAMIPLLKEVVEEFLAWYLVNGKVIRQRIQNAMKVIVQTLRQWVAVFREMWPHLRALVDRFGGFEGVLKKLAVAIVALHLARTTQSLIELGGATVKAVKSFAALAAAAGTSSFPLLLLSAAIAAIVFLASELKGYSDGKDNLISRFLQMKDPGPSWMGGLRESLRDLLKELGMLRDVDAAESLWKLVPDKKAERGWVEWLDDFMFNISKDFDSVGKMAAGYLFVGLFTALSGGMFIPLYLASQALWTTFGDDAKQAASDAADWLKETIGGAFDWMGEKIAGFASWVAELLAPVVNMVERIWGVVGGGVSSLAGSAGGAGSRALGFLGSAPGQALLAGPGAMAATLVPALGLANAAGRAVNLSVGEVSVVAPPGASPGQFGDAAQDGLTAALGAYWERISRSYAGGEE